MAPLDWGLGHATRCIPVISALLDAGYEVIVAGEGAQANLLKTEFPDVVCLPLAGYKVRYSRSPALLAVALLRQLPRLAGTIRSENRWLADIITQYGIDLVISDNRYGLYTSKVPCVFITHQLQIKAPFGWLESILQHINYKYINRFTMCWVPDAAGEVNAAGILSHPRRMPAVPVHYLGMLSRFRISATEKKYDYCILLSGPEPQRTALEKKLMADINTIPGKILLVRGKPGSNETMPAPLHVEIKNHLANQELELAILQSGVIVSRSGYTTVMELLSLHKRSILIPTPGQTEQEYLAQKLQKNKYAFAVKQSRLNCVADFISARAFSYQQVDVPVCDDAKIRGLMEEIFSIRPV